MTISLNGDPYEIDAPLTVGELLARLEIDPRRVAVEHNSVVVKRAAYGSTLIDAGDEVEVVNFVGGGVDSFLDGAAQTDDITIATLKKMK